MSYATNNAGEMRLYSPAGDRLYINEEERLRFMRATSQLSMMARLFCLTLAYTGCRISEARLLRRGDLQLSEARISFKTLKRKRKGVVREVPIPKELVDEFLRLHFIDIHLEEEWLFSDNEQPPPRTSSYRWVKQAMDTAGIHGDQACPKGLRHGYGVHATKHGVQLHMLQKWMGHAHMTTTAIYATALGPEELEVAARMW